MEKCQWGNKANEGVSEDGPRRGVWTTVSDDFHDGRTPITAKTVPLRETFVTLPKRRRRTINCWIFSFFFFFIATTKPHKSFGIFGVTVLMTIYTDSFLSCTGLFTIETMSVCVDITVGVQKMTAP